MYELTDTHFSVMEGALRLHLAGYVFVMYKTPNCGLCNKFLPLYDKLSKIDKRVTWAIVDVGKYRKIPMMAKNTSTPIKGVPTFIFYVNGKPHITYKGPRTIEDIRKSLTVILSKLNQPQQPVSFVTPPPPSTLKMEEPRVHHKSTKGQAGPNNPTFVSELATPKNVIPHNAPYMAYKTLDSRTQT